MHSYTKRVLFGAALLLLAGFGCGRATNPTGSENTTGSRNPPVADGSSNGGVRTGTGTGPQETIDITSTVDASKASGQQEKASIDGSETDTGAVNEVEAELNAYATLYAQSELN